METHFITSCEHCLFGWPAGTMKRHFISRCFPNFPFITISFLQTSSRWMKLLRLLDAAGKFAQDEFLHNATQHALPCVDGEVSEHKPRSAVRVRVISLSECTRG
jgi:hypothetical protein